MNMWRIDKVFESVINNRNIQPYFGDFCDGVGIYIL